MFEATRKEVTLKELVKLIERFSNRREFITWVNTKYMISQERARMIHKAVASGNMDEAEGLYREIKREWRERKKEHEEYEKEEQKRFEERQEEQRAIKQMRQEIHEIHDLLIDWYKMYLLQVKAKA